MDREKIIELLGYGYAQNVVASAVGCTDAYVSQILAEEGVRDKVVALRMSRLTANVEADTSIDEVEKLALDKVRRLLPMVTKPLEALRIFQTMNAANRKTVAPTTQHGAGAPIVNITLPAGAAAMFKLSSDKQVTEVDGRSLVTLSASALNERVKERREIANNTVQITDQSNAERLLEQIGREVLEDQVTSVL